MLIKNYLIVNWFDEEKNFFERGITRLTNYNIIEPNDEVFAFTEKLPILANIMCILYQSIG